MINTQPIEKSITDETLDVIDIFDTIQGEGPFAGTPAIFVRLAGCNLQCSVCDTVYTGPHRKMMEIDDLCDAIGEFDRRELVVITGGEPFRQSAIVHLVRELLTGGWLVQIETNGTFAPPFRSSTHPSLQIVCSPKTPVIHHEAHAACSCYKYVVRHGETDPLDGLPTKSMAGMDKPVARPPEHSLKDIFIQPMDECSPKKNKRNLRTAVSVCREFGYRLSLQLHKELNLP